MIVFLGRLARDQHKVLERHCRRKGLPSPVLEARLRDGWGASFSPLLTSSAASPGSRARTVQLSPAFRGGLLSAAIHAGHACVARTAPPRLLLLAPAPLLHSWGLGQQLWTPNKILHLQWLQPHVLLWGLNPLLGVSVLGVPLQL